VFVITPKSLFAFALLLATASGETIRLKNGRSILADSVRESRDRVEYTIGENTFAIRRSSVERIDAGGAPFVSVPAKVDLPSPAISGSALQAEPGIESRVVHDNRVDVEALASIEQEGTPDRAALAFYFAGQFERSKGGLDAAARYFERARNFLPENEVLIAHHASVLLQLNRMSDAARLAQQVIRMNPKMPSAYSILGYAMYLQGKMKDAVANLKKSYELQPDGQIKQLLDKVEREANAEGDFDEQSTSHFVLRFEGGQVSSRLRRQILDTLEIHFDELVHELDFSPREPVSVILYPNQQFFDVTKAPSWTGALNDGKLRLPVSGLTELDTELAHTLKHELAHSFINQMTRGRGPTWLHEGVAQMVEPQSSAGNGQRLSRLYGASRNIPLNQLESPFIRFSPAEAQVAYAQSLISVEYIRDVYGMSSVIFILKNIGSGQSTEAAMRSTIHSGYDQFQREITDWLRRTYGD
jgi:tetratricopeptide (TPR) repeat protein